MHYLFKISEIVMKKIIVVIYLLICGFNLSDKRNHKVFMVLLDNSYQGNLNFRVVNNSFSPAEIRIPAGLILKNSDTTCQDLFVPYPVLVRVEPGRSEKISIPAYCCKLKKKCPSSGQKFTYNISDTNTTLYRFASLFKNSNEKISHDVMQTMVWCLSDKNNPASIPVLSERMQSYKKWICEQLGVTVPWYFIKQSKYVLPGGQVHLVNDSLICDFRYDAPVNKYVCFEFTDTEGKEVYFAQNQWVYVGENSISLRVKIADWAKGKYFLRVKADGLCYGNTKEIII